MSTNNCCTNNCTNNSCTNNSTNNSCTNNSCRGNSGGGNSGGADLGGLTGNYAEFTPTGTGDEQELEAVAAGPAVPGEDMP
jgi:hypothetical protein